MAGKVAEFLLEMMGQNEENLNVRTKIGRYKKRKVCIRKSQVRIVFE